MITVDLNLPDGVYTLNLPTKLDEIKDSLHHATEKIHVAENQSLIAICYKETLSNMVLAGKQKKNINTPVVPIFIKTGGSTSEFINGIKCGEKIIISPSQLAVGHHVVVPSNRLSVDRVIDVCLKDKDIVQKALKYKEEPAYFIEYKIVGNFDIVGNYED